MTSNSLYQGFEISLELLVTSVIGLRLKSIFEYCVGTLVDIHVGLHNKAVCHPTHATYCLPKKGIIEGYCHTIVVGTQLEG